MTASYHAASVLAAVAKWPAWRKFEFEERAAIIEYEARLPRAEAERIAYKMMEVKKKP